MLARRKLLGLAAMAAALPIIRRNARAESYPARPIRLIVGFPSGGPNDILARLIAGWLAGRIGQPVEVENQPGNSGNVATASVVRAAPDGHTLLLVGPANAIGAALHKLDFDFLHDIAPVAGITREPLVLLVHPAVPANTVAELIAYAKANPGKVRMASTGAWSSPHVSGELFKMMTGIAVETVHYAGGGPALRELAAGNAQMMFEPISAAIGPVRAGRLRALAVTTLAHSPALPDVPSVADTVPGYEASAATGIGAPRGTPAEIVERLNREVNAAFADASMRARLLDTGGSVLPGTPAEFGKLLAGETEKWGNVVRFAAEAK